MRVILPFVAGHLEDGVYEAISDTGYGVELHDVAGSDTAYHRLLVELWNCGEDVAIIEQDIRIKSDTLEGFANCPNGWCAGQYAYLGSENFTGLGCVRFRAEFMATHSDVMIVAGEYTDPTHVPGHWCVCDHAIGVALRARNVVPCIHGHVEHISDGVPSHPPCKGNGFV